MRGSHRGGIERLRPQAVADGFLGQPQIGLRGGDLYRFVGEFGAQYVGVDRRQARRNAIEPAGQAVVDPRHGRAAAPDWNSGTPPRPPRRRRTS